MDEFTGGAAFAAEAVLSRSCRSVIAGIIFKHNNQSLFEYS